MTRACAMAAPPGSKTVPAMLEVPSCASTPEHVEKMSVSVKILVSSLFMLVLLC
jgi:hypothetical protein